MASRKERFWKRIIRFWTGDRGVGKPTRTSVLVSWISLASLRAFIVKQFVAFWVFKTPSWAIGVQKLVYAPGTRTRWHDYLNPIYWVLWIFGFAFQWIVSRPYTSLGPAVPALVLGLMLVGLGFRFMYEKTDWRGGMYRDILARSVQTEDHKLSRLVLLNLMSRYPDNTEYRLQQALLEDKLGNENVATKAMASLATSKQNPVAAYWLVTKQFSLQSIVEWTPEKHKQFRGLMEIALKGLRGQNEVAARTHMGTYLFLIGASSEAIQNLASVASRNRELYLVIAQFASQSGDVATAKQYGGLALQYYDEILLNTPGDTAARLNLARTLVILEREDDAARRLSEGFKITGDQQLSQAGGEAIAAWANRIAQSEPTTDNLLLRLQLLSRAMQLSPKNPLVLESLIQLAIQCADNKSGEVETMRRAMLNGLSPEDMHFIQGTVDLMRGDINSANDHLKLAGGEAENLPGVLNNLAVALYQGKEPDLERALSLSNAALARLDHPYLHETRGQILVRMKQYQEAIPDLEAALKAQEISGPVHASLAIAYDKIGQPELAKAHLDMAAEAKK